MGRSTNSFKSFVGHALEINFDKGDLPEKRLFIAVLSQAAHDCFSTHVEKYDREQAKSFFLSDTWHFKLVCEFADRNPLYVKDKMTRKILNNESIKDINKLKTYRREKKIYRRLTT